MSASSYYGRYTCCEDAAQAAYQELSSPGIPIPLLPVLKRCGVQPVLSSSLTQGAAGCLYLHDGHWYMALRSGAPVDEQRLSIAEEIGHFLLGHPMCGGQIRCFDRSLPGPRQASERFAVRFLIPACQLPKGPLSPDFLAGRFVVPRLFLLSHLSLLTSDRERARTGTNPGKPHTMGTESPDTVPG